MFVNKNPKATPVCEGCLSHLARHDSNFYQPSAVDQFLSYEHENKNSTKSVRVTSDIYMLLNQKRLDCMTREALVNYFDSMSMRNDSLSQLRSKLGDDQLIKFVKSRYIQQPSELLSWSTYLNAVADEELTKFKLTFKEKQELKQNTTDTATAVKEVQSQTANT